MVQALSSESKSLFGNPWRFDQWNITLQGSFIKRYGEAKAAEFAKLAGSKIGNTRPTIPGELTRVIIDKRTIIINRRGGSTDGASGGTGGPVLPTALATKVN